MEKIMSDGEVDIGQLVDCEEALDALKKEVEQLRIERDELKEVVLQIVDRIVPLTPVVLAAINSRSNK